MLTAPDWGIASAMTSVEILWRYGDAFSDVGGNFGCGVNGCTVRAVRVEGSGLSLDLETDFRWTKPLRVVCRNVPAGRLALRVNGRAVGDFTAEELERGVPWTPET